MTSPYAREDLLPDLLQASPAEMYALAKELKQAVRRKKWRKMLSVQASQVAAALRGLQAILGEKYVGRIRSGDRWEVHARDENNKVVPVAEVTMPRPSSWEEAVAPVTTRILRPDLLDATEVERWQQRTNAARRKRLAKQS